MMSSVSFFLYCDGVQAQGALPQMSINVLNPKIVFTPMFIPGQYSFSVVIGIVGLDVEEEDHKYQYIFSGPNGEEIINSGEFMTQRPIGNPFKLPPDKRGGMISLDFKNVIMNENGVYSSEIICDKESLGKYPIYVKGMNDNE